MSVRLSPPTLVRMAGNRRTLTGTLTSAALAAGLLVGGAVVSTAGPVGAAVTIDRPTPKVPPGPGERPDPRCDRAEQGLAVAKANVTKARQRLKSAPKSKKPARRAALKDTKQARTVAKARVARYC